MTKKINEIITLTDENGKQYFEVWIDYPFDLMYAPKTAIPIYSYDKEELKKKMIKAIADKNMIEKKREYKYNTPNKLLNCFPYLLGYITEAEAMKIL